MNPAARLACAALLALWGSHSAAAPQRVVSLNLCGDELAARLLPPERIAALSFLARDPAMSTVAAQARTLPAARGAAEEVLALKPDLVIAGAFTTPMTQRWLKARGVPVLVIGEPRTISQAAAEVRRVAAALGEPAKGEAIARSMETLRAPADARKTALVFGPNGYTGSDGGLSADVLRLAGLRMTAPGRDAQGRVSLETVILTRPELLIVGSQSGAGPSLADNLMRHPALKGLKTVRVPSRLWSCPGPQLLQAVAALRKAAQ